MTSQPQRIMYYGDMSLTDLQKVITDKPSVHPATKPLKQNPDFDRLQTKENKVYFAHYDAKQSLCR